MRTLLLFLSITASAQSEEIAIWPGAAPGSETWTHEEVAYTNNRGHQMVRNIVRPTLTPFLPDPDKANGTAIVICPGGGFRFLSWESEGTEVAKWLAAKGVASFVLKYRVMNTGATEAEFQKAVAELFARVRRTTPAGPDSAMTEVRGLATADGRQAIKVVRSQASRWNISPDRIGILGFSAGGVVTMGLVMKHDSDSKPNFAAPVYGGSTDGQPVPAGAPPLFTLSAADDPGGSASSEKLYAEWKAAGKPVELHIYAKGGHGFGMNQRGLPVDRWIERLGDWMDSLGLLKKAN